MRVHAVHNTPIKPGVRLSPAPLPSGVRAFTDRCAWLPIILLIVLIPTCSLASTGFSQADSVRRSPFALDGGTDALILGAGSAAGITGVILLGNVEPLSVEEVLALDPGDINSFDRASITPFRETLDGDVMMYASFLLPLSLLSHEGCREDIRTLGVMWAEVLLLEAGLNAAVKSTVLRTRPYAYDDATPMDKSTSRDARLSFFSGHTGITAATSFYIASVFSAYPVSSATKTLIWAGAVLYPAVTAYLRRDSGNHFRTDVITGYAVGGLIGWLVPFLHRTGRDAGVAIGPSVSPAGSGLRFAWTLQ